MVHKHISPRASTIQSDHLSCYLDIWNLMQIKSAIMKDVTSRLTNDTTDCDARNGDSVWNDGRLIDDHLPHHQLGLVHGILHASDHQCPVLILLTLASKADPCLGWFLDLKQIPPRYNSTKLQVKKLRKSIAIITITGPDETSHSISQLCGC